MAAFGLLAEAHTSEWIMVALDPERNFVKLGMKKDHLGMQGGIQQY